MPFGRPLLRLRSPPLPLRIRHRLRLQRRRPLDIRHRLRLQHRRPLGRRLGFGLGLGPILLRPLLQSFPHFLGLAGPLRFHRFPRGPKGAGPFGLLGHRAAAAFGPRLRPRVVLRLLFGLALGLGLGLRLGLGLLGPPGPLRLRIIRHHPHYALIAGTIGAAAVGEDAFLWGALGLATAFTAKNDALYDHRACF